MLGKYVLKISDMGLSKQLDHAGQSFSFTSFSVETYGQNQQLKENNQSVDNHMHNNNLVGTIGWQAPELVVQRNCETSQSYTMDGSGDCKTNRGEDRTIESSSIHRKTQNVDIFSLGCVLYYVLTLGEHPFGNWYEREINIVNHRYNLSHLACPDAAALIESMISAEPENRPSAKEVCAHPFFWSSSKRLEFLTELSDRLEQESPNSPMVLSLEANASNIVGVGWDRKLESALLEDMGKYRKYDTNSVRDLLRLIRNKRHHYHELTADIKKVVGNLPNEFLNYFEVRFPKLTLHCHGIHQQFLTSDGKDLFYEENNQKKALNHSKIISDTANLDIESSEGIIPKALDFDTKEKNLEFSDVTIWQNSSLEKSLKCQGWWRVTNSWIESKSTKKMRPSHLAKSAVDMKYRTRLCNHWESNHGLLCPMRKKGKCIFAHGPLELRVKENRRDKWLKNATVGIANNDSFVSSGGEDVFGAARSIEKVRAVEGSLSKFEKSSYTSEISNAPSDYHYSTVVSYPYPHYNPLPPTYAWSGGEETYAKEQQK